MFNQGSELHNTRSRISVASFIAVAVVLTVTLTQPSLRTRIVTAQPGLYSVSSFVDGDTIEVDMNGHTEKIRFIGVDTPETHKPNTPVQCYGPEAAAYTKRTINSQKFRLMADPLNTDRDRYGRLLRYVYLTDGTFMNRLLVEQGYGFYYPYFPFSKQTEFSLASRQAQQTKRGVWQNCHPTKTDSGGWLSNTEGT